MKIQLILIVTYVITFFLYMIVLWQISKKQKLKRQDLKTAFVITAITFVVSFTLMVPYQSGIIFPVLIRMLIGIFTFILTPFLIKKFYKTGWWKAIKIFILTIVITLLIIAMIFFIITLFYILLKLSL